MTASAGTLNGLSTDSTFSNGKLNNYSVNITGAAAGNVTITLADAACTGYVIVNVNIPDTTLHVVDAADSDWKGVPSTTGHDTKISNGEFIYTGVASDTRNDAGMTTNQDLTEVRFSGDTTFFYVLCRFRDINNTDEVHVALNIDADRSSSDDALTWLAPSDQGLGLGAAAQYGETNISLHNPVSGTPKIELYDQGDNQGSPWHAPASPGSNDSIAMSTSTEILEAAVPWGQLTPVVLPQKIRITLATFDNVVLWNNGNNTTGDYGGGTPVDAVDIMTPYCDSGAGSWSRDISDRDYDSFVTVGFNKDGRVNSFPDTPTPDTPGDGYMLTSTMVTFQWKLNDVDSWLAKDSAVRVQVGTTAGGNDILDTKLDGVDLDLVYVFNAGTYYWRLRHSDDFETSSYTSNRSFTIPDTVDIKTPVDATGGSQDTTNATVVLTGKSSGAATDTVQVTVNGSDTTVSVHTSAGVWTCTATLQDFGGESVVVKLFRSGVQKANDTINLMYDATKPRITKKGDTSVQDGTSITGLTDQNAFFYVVDTGTGFDNQGGCTLYWHVDSGANTNWAVGSKVNTGSGTWTIEATIPASGFPNVDTKVGFWWVCRDDVANLMDSTSLSPSYLDVSSGTFTINVLSVRDVAISEIMADGDTGEYVELYNTTGDTVNLNGWKLMDAGSSTQSWIAAFGSGNNIRPYGYFLVFSDLGVASYDVHTIADAASHDTFAVDGDWYQDDLRRSDTLTLRDASNVEIDSSEFSAEWGSNGPGGDGTDTTTNYSLERKLTMSGGKLVAGYEGTESEWDTSNGRIGAGGRKHGTPGHANSINVPTITSLTSNCVQSRGRGKYDITITNGNVAFEASNGRIVVTPPADWSPFGTTSTESGYTTVNAQSGGSDYSSLTISGRSAVVQFNAFPAGASITLRYGDDASTVSALAQFQSSPGLTRFQLFYDTGGTTYAQVGDSLSVNFGAKSDTIVVDALDTYVEDTNPSTNPQTFFKGEYQLAWTVADSMNRKVFGAHVYMSTQDRTNTQDTMYPTLSNYDQFTGAYEALGSDTKVRNGWTNASGQFTVTVDVSETEGANVINIRDTDFDPQGATPETHVYTDSARAPVPVISEAMWAGGAAAQDWIELYNPTHATQSLAGYAICRGVSSPTDSTLNVVTSTTNFGSRSIPPFSYLLIENSTAGNRSAGDSPDMGSIGANLTTTDTSLILFRASGKVDEHTNRTGSGNWFGGGNGSGANDTSMERVYPNRSGTISAAWSSSDSTVGFDSGGSPRRPNAQSLATATFNFFEVLDTFIGKNVGPTDTTLDTARISFTLKIVTGDTQPNQPIGIRAFVDKGPVNYGSASVDSSWLVTVTPTDSTNPYGTAAIQISSNGNNFSGTVTIRCRQPFGVPDTAFVVFDRGDSLGYVFQSSETNIFDTSATNALLVKVSMVDTFSGIDTSLMPQLRWKIGSGGTYSALANMTYSSGDTYLYRIDISTDTWSKIPHDTIYWQVTWRDKAGNYDTSPNNNSLSGEYIDNTRAYDTIQYPAVTDTGSGDSVQIRILISDAAADYCTVVLKYDTYNSGLWTNVPLKSGDSTDLRVTPSGDTYIFGWNTLTQFADTTVPTVRLRIEVYDGFDTRTDTSVYFGITNQLPDTPVILMPAPSLAGALENTTTVRIVWRFRSSLSGDTQQSWEVQIDTGPSPDWAQLADSRTGYGTDTDNNETRTVALTGAQRYHVRMRTKNLNGYSPYSEDTWFWVPKRVMDGFANDWTDTSGPDTDGAYVGGGEYIWMDRIGDERADSAPGADFDLAEFRVTSDSYFYFFLFRMAAMSSTSNPLFSISIDSDRTAADTNLEWMTDDSTRDSSTRMGLREMRGEVNIDYGLISGDSPIWLYRDTEGGNAWKRENGISYEYIRASTQKIGELAIPKRELRPNGPSAVGDTIRLVIGISKNNGITPTGGDRTDNYLTTDHTDNLYPGNGAGAWSDDLSDGDMDYYVDIYFRDTGDVSPNAAPTGSMAAISPTDDADTSAASFNFRWQPATDANAADTVTYWFRMSTDKNFVTTNQQSFVVWGGETIALSGVTLTDLDSFYWQVRARDNHGQYGAWSDTYEFRYRKATIHDGDTSDWTGTPSATVHDTAISQGEFIYTGVNGDSRSENSNNADKERDINQVRFSGDTNNLRFMVRFNKIDSRDDVHVALGIDKDLAPSGTGLYFIGDDEGMRVGSTALYPETAVLFHDTGTNIPQIEMYDTKASPGNNWHVPPVGSADSIGISTLNNVLEAAILWKDLSVTLPTRLRFIVAAYDNTVTAANSGDATRSIASGYDVTDVMTPYCANGDNAWTRDISDGDFDSSVIVPFNKNGKVNHPPDTAVLTSPANATTFSSSNNFVNFRWVTTDIDSFNAVDSEARLQVSRFSSFSSLQVDSSYEGIRDSVTIGLAANDTYYWRVRYRDDFSTAPVQGVTDTRFFAIAPASGNTAPYDTIILPSRGDSFVATETYSGQVTVKFVMYDADSNFCTTVVQFSKDSGVNWQTATLTGTSTISNLYSPTMGDTKTIVWLSKTDLPDTLTSRARLRVIPSDGTDTGKADTTITFGIDNQKPSVIDTLTAVADVTAPDTGVYLLWSTSSAVDSKGYNVYRCANPSDSATSTKVNVSVITDTFGFKDSSAVQGDTRHYYITVVDTYDNESDSSELEAAPNLEVVKTLVDSSSLKGIRPGDTVSFRITVRNNGFAPAAGIVLYDYVPANSVFSLTDTATASSVFSSWTVHYRVTGSGSSDVWQTPVVDTATMVRYTRANRMDPSTATPSDTLTLKIKIQ